MSYQINVIMKNTEWVTPSEFPDLSEESEIAIDLETRDENMKKLGTGWARHDGEIVGIAVAAGSFKGYYPINHQGGGNLPRGKVITWFQSVLKTNADKIFHNAQYDLGWIRAQGWEVKGRIIDTMIAAALIDENRFSYSLNALGFDYLGEIKAEDELKEAAAQRGLDAKAELWKLPAMDVGFYAEQDAALTLKLWNYFKPTLVKENLLNVWQLEMELLPILIGMRETGIRVDIDKAETLKKTLLAKELELMKKIKGLTGQDVEIWAARSVAKAFDQQKIKYDVTEKSKAPSFTTNWLENCNHPLARYIKDAREINKLHSTFIDSILKYEHKGRIHAEINQLRSDMGGTVSGRLSMANPNLQQVPARSKEYGRLIRGLFLPEKGCKWGSFDYSQQEPRLVVHYAATTDKALGGLQGSQQLIDAYQNDDADFHQTVASMAGIPRSQAKTINLGIFYGMGSGKLSKQLGISFEEAKALLKEYDAKVPFVKQLANRVMQQAEKSGSIKTLLGRKCRFDKWEPKSFGLHKAMTEKEYIAEYGSLNSAKRAFTYKALNRLIQGSAADQVKAAMINCDKNGHVPMLQIHDELCFSVETEEDEAGIEKAMVDNPAVSLVVPSKVDKALGDDWGEAT
jgi:DNA polymerase I-like protein with 3'-5' exonuclease and polymerase domains